MDNNELRIKFFRKLDTVINEVDKITEKKQGYNFSYVDIENILVEVDKSAAKNKMLVITAPNWRVNKVTGDTDVELSQVGKEFIVKGSMVFEVVDIETGYGVEFIKVASGKGTDPGQAVGSAESYALRQFLNKTFKVEIDKEVDVSTVKYVFDKNGDACLPLMTGEISEIAGLLSAKTGDSSSIKQYVYALLNRYNKHFKTDYGKLGEFPSTELQDLKNFASAISKDELENFDA